MLLAILRANKLLERFTKKNYTKTNQKEPKVEKVIKRRSNQLCVKWEDYNSFFNVRIDKKDIV